MNNKNANLVAENSARIKHKLNDIESTNFTFVENKGSIRSSGLNTARIKSSQEIIPIEE